MTSSGDFFQILFSNVWGIILVIAFFCGSIFVHELGHFLAAKWRGLKIEKFSIGFGPRIFGWTKDGIDYRISLLPLGGYVALPQLADLRAIEGETDDNAETLPPISYADKMIVSVAGAVFNVIFAFALALIVWGVGHPSSEGAQSNVIGMVVEEMELDEKTIQSPASRADLQPGDTILKIDNNTVNNFQDITQAIITGAGRDDQGNPKLVMTVDRGGDILDIPVYPQLVEKNSKSKERMRQIGIAPSNTVKIGGVVEHSPAQAAGVQTGDIVRKTDGKAVYSIWQMREYLKSQSGKEVTLTIERNGQEKDVKYVPLLLPATKPLFEFAYQAEDKTEVLTLLPHYAPGETKALDSPSKPSRVTVFQIPEIGYAVHEKLRVGDTVTAVNGSQVKSIQDVFDALQKSTKQTVTLEIQRGTNTGTFEVAVNTPGSFRIVPSEQELASGFILESTSVIVHPTPVAQFVDKVKMTFSILGSLLNRNSDISLNHLMGPVGIARVLHSFSLQDLRLVLWFTVLLNINLAILNLLPIPVLDGGHMMFATLGKLRGKSLPANFIAGTQGAFMIMLLGLMMYIVFYDSLRWMGDHDYKQRMLQRQAYLIDFVYPEPEESGEATK